MKKFRVMDSVTVLFGGLLASVMIFAIGCEWTGTSSGEAWNESMDWVNFSGLYRAPSGRNLVGDFASAGGGAGNGVEQEFAQTDQAGPVLQPATVFQGTINFMNRGTPGWSIKPGSVTIEMEGTGTGPFGSFSDGGNNQLSGSYSQVPLGANFSGTGTINYDTGAWSIFLDSDFPFIEPAQITYSYVVVQRSGAAGDAGGVAGDTAGTGVATVGGTINTIQVEQLGNRLTFRTSRGHVLSGQLGMVTLPGGDQTGRSAGDVSATYEVEGDIDGQRVRITGTLSGVYVPPADIQFVQTGAPIIYGILSNRILQGIWMQPNGTADVYGVAPQQSVPVNVGDFAPLPEDDDDTTTTTPVTNNTL